MLAFPIYAATRAANEHGAPHPPLQKSGSGNGSQDYGLIVANSDTQLRLNRASVRAGSGYENEIVGHGCLHKPWILDESFFEKGVPTYGNRDVI